MRTLIIEDDPSVGRSIELVLKSRGHTCTIAETGAAGLEAARAQDHDIILLDLSLPDTDGHSILRQMRAAKIRTPVLILSGSQDLQDKVEGLGIGADDYVTKPFEKEELLARIRAIVRRATGRMPPAKAAVLDGLLLAKRGAASAWSFTDSYTPPIPGKLEAGEPQRQGSSTTAAIGLGAPSPDETLGVAPLRQVERKTSVPNLGPARIIVLGNAKGGTGKSTIAMNLIVALLSAGHKVGSIDCDHPQGTLTRYVENRRRFMAEEAPDLVMPNHETLNARALAEGRADRILGQHSNSQDFVIIDTPGYDTPLSRWAHGHASTLITPINDSLIDLDVLGEIGSDTERPVRPSPYSGMVELSRQNQARAGHGGIDWIILRNRLANLNAKNRRQVAEFLTKLRKSLRFRDGPGLRERVIYRELFLLGLTLLDLPCGNRRVRLAMSHVAARQELRQLLEVIQPSVTPLAQSPNKRSRPKRAVAS